MFLKKSSHPRIVTLPDGRKLSVADLPPGKTRWVASRKEAVVNAVRYGLLSRAEAIARYELSEEELSSWEQSLREHGKGALKVTASRRDKQPKVD